MYKDQRILMCKEVYALEKLHGTSSHVSWDGSAVTFFAGGADRAQFVKLFDEQKLKELFQQYLGAARCTVFGEAYGGKLQGMSATYGKDLKFAAFEVQIGDIWLSVPKAEELAKSLGFEFVHYVKIPTTLAAVDAERDAPSVQAVRNGITEPKPREGIVLRPLEELTTNAGRRIIAKHKGEAFAEHKHAPKVLHAGEFEMLRDARLAAEQWVVPMRLEHVLQSLPGASSIEHTGDVIKAVVADIKKESEGEIVWSKAVEKEISRAAALLWKQRVTAITEHTDQAVQREAAEQPS